jgi:hypothetical protein
MPRPVGGVIQSIKIEIYEYIGGNAWESNPPDKNDCYVRSIYYAGDEGEG